MNRLHKKMAQENAHTCHCGAAITNDDGWNDSCDDRGKEKPVKGKSFLLSRVQVQYARIENWLKLVERVAHCSSLYTFYGHSVYSRKRIAHAWLDWINVIIASVFVSVFRCVNAARHWPGYFLLFFFFKSLVYFVVLFGNKICLLSRVPVHMKGDFAQWAMCFLITKSMAICSCACVST